MDKKKPLLYIVLFGLLMVLLFLPLSEERLQLFKFKSLSGVYHKAPKPEFNFQNYKSGLWQQQVESYLSENFGFRIPIIRMYNQYVYDFYHKTFNQEIAVGNDGWLYQKDGVLQYFGLEGQRYGLSNEQFEASLALETRCLVKIRAILKEYGVELMTFTLPVKSYVYPEHLRPQRFIDTTFLADEYYDKQLTQEGFPHINMNAWFQAIRDDYPFTLFYEKGDHWASGAVLATDSLFRFMETLKGDRLARIVMGTPYEVPEKDIPYNDRDLAEMLNIVKIPKQKLPLYEIPVTIEADSNTVYPSALFVGTSYFWYMTPRVPFEKVFRKRDLIFYDASFYTNEEQTIVDLKTIDYLREVLNHDYVIYFKNAPQLYYDTFKFYEKVLIGLCIGDERFQEKAQEVADSLAQYHPVESWQSSNYLNHAKALLARDPELFEELRGTQIPTARNPRLKQLLKEREIRNDRDWAFLLNCVAKHDSIPSDKVFENESLNCLNGQPLIKNKAFFTPYDYFDFLVEEALGEIRRRPESKGDLSTLRNEAEAQIDSLVNNHAFDNDTLMRMACAFGSIIRSLESPDALENIRQKAQQNQLSVDRMFNMDVLWVYKNEVVKPNVSTQLIKELFENYKIEFRFRHHPESMEHIKQKAINDNKPFLVAIDQDVVWVQNNP